MRTNRPDHGALLLMSLTVVLWGFSWIVMKRLASLMGPFDMVMWRYGLAFIVLLVTMWVKGYKLRIPPVKPMLAIGLFQTTLFQCLCQWALISGGAGHVVMLAYTMPFWVVVFAWPLLGERPSSIQAVAISLAAAGLIAVIAPWEGMGTLTGSMLALAGGASWGFGTVLAKDLFQRYQPDVMSVTTLQMLLGALFTFPITLIMPQQEVIWTVETVLGLLYMAVLASALGWWLWMSVIRRVSATVAGMSSLGVPVVTILLAWLILNERPTGSELIGIACIMTGLVLVNLAHARRR